MIVHNFYDRDITGTQVHETAKGKTVEIQFSEYTEAIILNKGDVIALAKEFGLVVYESKSEC